MVNEDAQPEISKPASAMAWQDPKPPQNVGFILRQTQDEAECYPGVKPREELDETPEVRTRLQQALMRTASDRLY
jgi:hypothetical protein